MVVEVALDPELVGQGLLVVMTVLPQAAGTGQLRWELGRPACG